MLEHPEQQKPEPLRRQEASGTIMPGAPTGTAFPEPMEPPRDYLFGGSPGWGSAPTRGLSVFMLLRFKWLILGIFVFVSAVLIPCIWLFTSPMYRATAAIRVSPVVSRIVFKTEDNGIVPLYRSYLNTQVSIILSPKVLQRVLDRDEVQQTEWYKRPRHFLLGGSASPLERLRKDLSVWPRQNTELIDVAISTTEGKGSKIIIDAVVEEYKKYSDERLRKNDIRRLETLTSERNALQKEIDGLVATKFRFSSRLGTVDPEELRSQLSTHFSVMVSEHEALMRERSVAQWDFEQLSGGDEQGGIDADNAGDEAKDDDSTKRYLADSEWRKLSMGLETARHQLKLARQKYGDSHPRIEESTASVEHAKHLLRGRELQVDELRQNNMLHASAAPNGTTGPPDGEALAHRAGRLNHQIELLQVDIDRQRGKVVDAGEIAKEIAHYDEEVRYKRELYEAVRARLNALEMEGKAPARIGVAASAVEPSLPHRDRRLLLSAMALCGAMMMGIGVAYLRVSMDTRIRETSDVRQAVRVPFLGQLPPLPSATDFKADSSPVIMEGVRMVRTALLERISDTGGRVVLITSSSSRDGKTSVALLLAKSLAQLGKRTLLVEADLRKPSLAKRLNLEANAGLAALLNGTVDDAEAIVSTGVAKLDVLLAGAKPEGFDSELLANGVFATYFGRWKKSYDFILLDSPPVLPVADARILAGQADGTIMVLRSAHSRRAEVIQAYADLSASGGTLLGTVLIGVPSGGAYGSYRDYQGYIDRSGALEG